MNSDLLATKPHRSKRISDAAYGRPGIIDLAVADPAWAPPQLVTDRLRELAADPVAAAAAGIHRYAPAHGAQQLRQAIAEYYARTQGLVLDPETQILVTAGGCQALWTAIFTLTNRGDVVLLPDPCYLLYEPIVTSLGRRPVRLSTSAKDGYEIDPSAVAAHTGRASLLVFSSPANPTGAMLAEHSLRELITASRDAGVSVLHDEVLDRFAYGARHRSAAALSVDGASVTLANSFSKRFAMNGWRVGWLAGPAEVLAAAARAHTLMMLAVSSIGQGCVASALNDSQVDHEQQAIVDDVSRRGAAFARGLTELELFDRPVQPPAGGLYLFPEIGGLARKARNAFGDGPADEVVAEYLLERAGIAVVPGAAFGPSGSNHVRFSFATSRERLDEALGRLDKLARGEGQAR